MIFGLIPMLVERFYATGIYSLPAKSSVFFLDGSFQQLGIWFMDWKYILLIYYFIPADK
jgi:hypothetical protein